jgi:hypothetical protein
VVTDGTSAAREAVPETRSATNCIGYVPSVTVFV